MIEWLNLSVHTHFVMSVPFFLCELTWHSPQYSLILCVTPSVFVPIVGRPCLFPLMSATRLVLPSWCNPALWHASFHLWWFCNNYYRIEICLYCRHGLVPRPRPSFHCLQYGKAVRVWYLFSMWARCNQQMAKKFNEVSRIVQPTQVQRLVCITVVPC